MFKKLRITVTEADDTIWGVRIVADLLKTMDALSDLKLAGEIKAYSIHVEPS